LLKRRSISLFPGKSEGKDEPCRRLLNAAKLGREGSSPHFRQAATRSSADRCLDSRRCPLSSKTSRKGELKSLCGAQGGATPTIRFLNNGAIGHRERIEFH